MNLNLMARLYKQSCGQLDATTNLTLDQLQKTLDDRYQHLKAFFTRQHWNALAQLGQQTLRDVVGWSQHWPEVAYEAWPSKWYQGDLQQWANQLATDNALMEQLAKSDAPDLQKVHQALEAWKEARNLSPLEQVVRAKHQAQAKQVEELKHQVLGVLTKALLALLHGNINAKVARLQAEEPCGTAITQLLLEDKDAALAALKTTVQDYQEQLDQQVFMLYQHSLNQEASYALLGDWMKMSNWASTSLIELGDLQNMLRAWINTLQGDRKNGFSEQVGFWTAQLGQLTRQIIAAMVSGLKLYLDGNSNPLVERAAQLPFGGVQLPDGKNIPIHHLAKAEEESWVEVAGFVQDIATTRTANGELISRAKLYDPSSKKSVWVGTVFTHLAHIGIGEGAYVIAKGQVYHQSKYAQGELGVHIDRLSRAQLSQKSWKMAFWHQAQPYYQVWYNGLQLNWSLSRHQHDHEQQEIYEVGANELFFQPLYYGEAERQANQQKYGANNSTRS